MLCEFWSELNCVELDRFVTELDVLIVLLLLFVTDCHELVVVLKNFCSLVPLACETSTDVVTVAVTVTAAPQAALLAGAGLALETPERIAITATAESFIMKMKENETMI